MKMMSMKKSKGEIEIGPISAVIIAFFVCAMLSSVAKSIWGAKESIEIIDSKIQERNEKIEEIVENYLRERGN